MIANAATTISATRQTLEAGFRHLDSAERYRTGTLDRLLPIYESARIKPTVVQVESHPYLPETQLLEFSRQKSVVFLDFAPLGQTTQRFNQVVETGSPGFFLPPLRARLTFLDWKPTGAIPAEVMDASSLTTGHGTCWWVHRLSEIEGSHAEKRN